MNFDLENVRPFLERIRPHIESDFADAQIDELVAFIEATPVEQEREMRLRRAERDDINRRGQKTSWVRIWPLAAWAIRPPTRC